MGLIMSNNREERVYAKSVHMFMGIQRVSKQGKKKCIRQVIKEGEEERDLQILESKLKVFGGEWRIHKTVNARNVEFARKYLIKTLIDYPENASFSDSIFRTGLLQRGAKETKFFMLDIDTQDKEHLKLIETLIKSSSMNVELGFNESIIIERIKSPNGYHYITRTFDTRDICQLEYVTLLRDGYYYVKTVRNENDNT